LDRNGERPSRLRALWLALDANQMTSNTPAELARQADFVRRYGPI
jgi:hypothetical protein